MKNDSGRYTKKLEEQDTSYSDEPDYYGTWLMELQWKQPDGTTKPLVTIEVKDEVQRVKIVSNREY